MTQRIITLASGIVDLSEREVNTFPHTLLFQGDLLLCRPL
ncbi:uncharacterized protein METZ01_LOCUS515819, partial [marine metagenome]